MLEPIGMLVLGLHRLGLLPFGCGPSSNAKVTGKVGDTARVLADETFVAPFAIRVVAGKMGLPALGVLAAKRAAGMPFIALPVADG
ncbi:hypothetical protein SE18_24440 [Herpetosiphon geysericola]|uniref:Uncharacterized protein n=1 Tax=Herpetosiphon geysericola TaxID=70996 RepID=A0A0P6XBT3_9CHLR|nr:hypothetical protein SE18_24440 [Herpetosiphon geysericola]